MSETADLEPGEWAAELAAMLREWQRTPPRVQVAMLVQGQLAASRPPSVADVLMRGF